ncbi:serine protease snake-like [Spodoptera litura]|uniref:Serine protease snake-like n=1 Tax=Spodoptera litura TaxID=69820 RepID=A0A9J7EWD1_SPOLT|nr:serine protease snake-like [Spodoptera litura]
MGANVYRVFVFLSFLSFVLCDLNLQEDEPCVTDGLNGTCVGIFRCPSASLSYLYANAGYVKTPDKIYDYPELPDICSYKNEEPVVCCTDCNISNAEPFRHTSIGPLGIPEDNEGPVAWSKCLDYLKILPYPCRAQGKFEVRKYWNENRKCYGYVSSIALVFATGGIEAQRWEFPHMALLGYGDEQKSAQWLCGGTVISERFILTAAHCTRRALGNVSYAALGILKRTDPKELWNIHNIKRIIPHPEYNPPSKYHDIALLETETEINFGKNLLPACLDTGKKKELTADASGWGRLGHMKDLADTLQVVTLQEFEETECATFFSPHRHLKHGYDHEKQMCYGNHQKIIDTCEGDSGGPLQTNQFKCQYTVVGVTSFGKYCGILGSPGMYTRVSYYVPWIEAIVWPEETKEHKKKDDLLFDKWLNATQQ